MRPEFIVCSAIYYDDGKERVHNPTNLKDGLVVCGFRHHNCYTLLAEMFPNREYIGKEVEGFLTSRHQFVDRQGAMRIAEQANQIHYKHGDVHELYSEDIF